MSDDLTAGGRIGQLVDDRYKLTEVMAAGAMGEVYKAERVPVGKLVAVKFLHASFVSDSEFQARFDRETRVMSRLAHPNCVSVVDFGVWKDNPYLVMDFVAGTTLRKRLDDVGVLTPAQAMALARQITAGLAHAHEQGIIHRDIKPANIMISDEIGHGERVRILDFGLARLRGGAGGSEARRDATQTNMVVGTPNYMAPEQTVPGATIDARTDLYAVGIVLFEMIAGERPFAAEDTMALLGMHRGAPIPRLVDRAPEGTELPDGLQALIDKAMAKAPSDRFQTAIEMQQAIDEITNAKAPIVIEPHGKGESAKLARPAGATAVGAASTLMDIDATKPEPMRPSVSALARPNKSRFWRTLIALLIVVGGASAMAGYLITQRDGHAIPPATLHDAAVAAVVVAHSDGALEAIANAPIDAAELAIVEVDASGSDSGSGSGSDSGSASGSGSGSGSDDEIEMDPEKAEDLDPAKGSADTAEDEAGDAPATSAEAEQKATPPAAPQLATNLHGAVVLIKEGKRQAALASLHILQKKSPKSAYIPFLLGSLYFDQMWWSVAMDNYAQAIHINVAYKNNPVINRNLIKMLSSAKTRARASSFLRGIGRSAIPYLRYAAAHDLNSTVKKTSASLLKQIR
ncbi:MAG: protein kinase [Kofleriaceae bacterium]